MVITLIASVKVKEGKMEEAIKVLKEVVPIVKKSEPGCLEYIPHTVKGAKEKRTIIFYEKYEDDKALKLHMVNLGKLEDLLLDNNQIVKINGELALPNLKSLYLSHNQISEIEGFSKLVNLETLYLSWNKISEIENLEKIVNLTDLYLSNNLITDIKGINTLDRLKILKLSRNNIKTIKGVEFPQSLGSLDLSYNPIPKQELEELEEMLPDCYIS